MITSKFNNFFIKNEKDIDVVYVSKNMLVILFNNHHEIMVQYNTKAELEKDYNFLMDSMKK